MLVRNELLKFLNIISKLLWKSNTSKKFIFLSGKCVKSDVVLIATVASTTSSTPAPAKGTTAAADATATAAADATVATNGDDIAL